MTTKKCPICGKIFEYNKNRKYCSDTCRAERNNNAKSIRLKELFENGLCTCCYKPKEKGREDKKLCLDCTQRHSHRDTFKYNNFKTKQKAICDQDCLNCKYDDCILEENDETVHNEFREKKIARNKKYQQKHPESHKIKYYKRKNSGKCVRCGRQLDNDKFVCCLKCRNELVESKIEKRRNNGGMSRQQYTDLIRERIENGLCFRCGKPGVEGKALCEEHLKMARKNYENHLKKYTDKFRKKMKIKKLKWRYVNSGKDIVRKRENE